MNSLGIWVHKLLDRPLKVVFICLCFALFSLSVNGGLLHLYNLSRDIAKMKQQHQIVSAEILDLNDKLSKARDPGYITRQALDHYELAEEDDLVFIFSDQ
jgi:cell division protein FtsB